MSTKTLIATLMCVIGVTMASNSPVFLWGANSPNRPALETIAQHEFAKLVAPLFKGAMVMVFLEDKLAPHDFVCPNSQGTDNSCYAHLQGVSPKTYYHSVENPVEALRSVASEREFNSVDKSGKLVTPLKCEANKVVFVSFDNSEQERGVAHDTAMEAISNEIDCPAVYMYMSAPSNEHASGSHRVRRATAAPIGGYLFRKDSQFLIFFTKLSIITTQPDNKKVSEELIANAMTVSNITTNNNNAPYNKFAVTLETTTTPVKFNITYNGGYFSMGNIVVGDVTFRSMSLDAPTDFSFTCGNLTLGAIWASPTEPATKVLKWNSLQFQAPFSSKYNNAFVFGDAWSCTGFFTPAILSGLFVVLIMLIILFVGVCWMMDINTMDRFDDPKGKTITINAAE